MSEERTLEEEAAQIVADVSKEGPSAGYFDPKPAEERALQWKEKLCCPPYSYVLTYLDAGKNPVQKVAALSEMERLCREAEPFRRESMAVVGPVLRCARCGQWYRAVDSA